MKARIYETFCVADVDALLDCGVPVAMQFDGSHPKAVKAVHLELAVQVSDDQIHQLRVQYSPTFIKLKAHLQHGGGTYKFEVPYFEQAIVDQSPKSFQIKQNRAVVRHGGTGDMVGNIEWW